MITLPIANPSDEQVGSSAPKTMNALVYLGPGKRALQERPIPEIAAATDAIVRVRKTTICAGDLDIVNGDIPTCAPGRILGHEGVGTIAEIGTEVTAFRVGDPVVISCISRCGVCENCRTGTFSQCAAGGWILGNEIDGTHAEYVRIPHANTSLYRIPAGVDEEALVMLSDILPTAFERGVLEAGVGPGSTVAIVGAGPVGLAALLTARLNSPATIVSIDTNDRRLAVATRFGATHTINCSDKNDGSAVAKIKELTNGRGVDTVINTGSIPDALLLCSDIIAPGGTVAGIAAHGDTVTTGTLLEAIQTQKIDPKQLVTHHFRLRRVEEAYDMFANSAKTQALKVIISA